MQINLVKNRVLIAADPNAGVHLKLSVFRTVRKCIRFDAFQFRHLDPIFFERILNDLGILVDGVIIGGNI